MTRMSPSNKICTLEVIETDDGDKTLSDAMSYVQDEGGHVDNMYKAMSLSPKVIKPIHDLYLAVLHDKDSPLEPWLGELLSVQVAQLNNCVYALTHHSANFCDYINDQEKSERMLKSLKEKNWSKVIEDKKVIAMLEYGEKLCLRADEINQSDIIRLRDQGLSDTEISYVSQINSGFAYWTRIINALGVELEEDAVHDSLSNN